MNKNLSIEQPQDSLLYYYNLANSPQTSSDLPLAYKFYIKQRNYNQAQNNIEDVINNLQQIAIIQFEMGLYSDSEVTVVGALKLLDTLEINKKTNESRVSLYNQLGRIYRVFRDFDIALDYYNKAEKITQSQNKLNIIQNNIAFIYSEQKKLDLAENIFQKIYKNSLKFNDSVQIARSIGNLGFIKAKLNKPEAISLIKEALRIRLKIKDLQGTYASYKHLTEYYRKGNNKKMAEFYADMALVTAKQINSPSYIEDALSNIIELNDDPKIILYKNLKDSLSEAKQIQDNKYALFKYNYYEQEKIAKENEIQKEKEKRLKLLYQGVGVFILLISIFLYFILKSKHKKEKIQQVYTTETRISKKVHDEVANEIYHAMTKLQSGATVKEELLDDLERVYTKTRDISKENSTIDFKGGFENVLNDLLVSYKDENVNVITRNLNKISWRNISELKKTAIYRVLQELMTNMKKHSQASIAVLSFVKEKNELIIDYKDDGIGCVIKKKGGLQNVENRIESINGTITFESEINNGFRATIRI